MRWRSDRTWMRSTHGCACHRTTRRNTSQVRARHRARARAGSTRDGKIARSPARYRAPGTSGLAEFERARMDEARVCDNLSGGPAGAGRGRPSPAEKCAQHRTPRIVTTLYTLNGAAGELGVLVPLETAQCVSLGRLPAPGTRPRCRCGHGTIKTRVVRDPAMSSAILHPTHALPAPRPRAHFQAIGAESCLLRNFPTTGSNNRTIVPKQAIR